MPTKHSAREFAAKARRETTGYDLRLPKRSRQPKHPTSAVPSESEAPQTTKTVRSQMVKLPHEAAWPRTEKPSRPRGPLS